MVVVVYKDDNNYENAYASHYFLFIKRNFLMAFLGWGGKEEILTLIIGDK